MVRSSLIEHAPVIDGRDDDACWGGAVEVADFLLMGSHRPAQEATRLKVVYDEEALYLFARCEESLLITASQRQHEIKAAAKERDGKVIEDDSLTLILGEAGSDKIYEFSINTLGILADARSSASSVWETRDLGWNASVKTAVVLDEGAWNVEMAIPWKELGVEAPKKGSEWKVVVARAARARGEVSSWNPSSPRGIHQPEQFGRLILGEEAIGVRGLERFDLLAPGKNELRWAVNVSKGRPLQLEVQTRMTPQDPAHPPVSSEATFKVTSPSEVVRYSFEAGNVGYTYFSWSIRDAATRETIYRSPALLTEVQSSRVTMRLTTPGAYRFLVNGKAIATGSSARKHPVSFFLRNGANLVALEAQAGVASVTTNEAEFGPGAIRWKMASASDASALSEASDDYSWPTAPLIPAGKGEVAMMGQPGRPVVLRHTVVLRETRAFPLSQPALYFAGNKVQGLNLLVKGLKGRTLDDWRLHLELPEGVEATGTPTYLGRNGYNLSFELQRSLRSARRIYVTKAVGSMVEEKSPPARLSLLRVALQRNGKAASGPLGTARYWVRANDQTVSELPQQISLVGLPEAQGIQPKEFGWQLWLGSFYRLGDAASRRELLVAARAAGFNEVVVTNEVDIARQRWTRAEAEKLGMRHQALLYFRPYGLNFIPYLEEHPEFRLIDSTGEVRDQYSVCTTILLDQGWREAGDRLLKEWVEEVRPHSVEYDYEFPPLTGQHACYCERCLAVFRKEARLRDGTSLNGEIISEKYRAAWVRFMAKRAAKLFLLIKTTLRESSPSPKFSVYSGYHTPENAARYGVDWDEVGRLQAVDSAACGYGRPVKAMQATVKALRGIPVKFGAIITPYLAIPPNTETPSRQLTRANLLRLALDATGGVLVYDLSSMDGRSFAAVGETTRLIATFESLFLTRKMERLPGQSVEEVQVLKGDQVALVCVMNSGTEEKDYSLMLPDEFGAGEEFYSKQKVAAGAEIGVLLPPGGTAVYVMGDASVPLSEKQP